MFVLSDALPWSQMLGPRTRRTLCSGCRRCSCAAPGKLAPIAATVRREEHPNCWRAANGMDCWVVWRAPTLTPRCVVRSVVLNSAMDSFILSRPHDAGAAGFLCIVCFWLRLSHEGLIWRSGAPRLCAWMANPINHCLRPVSICALVCVEMESCCRRLLASASLARSVLARIHPSAFVWVGCVLAAWWWWQQRWQAHRAPCAIPVVFFLLFLFSRRHC